MNADVEDWLRSEEVSDGLHEMAMSSCSLSYLSASQLLRQRLHVDSAQLSTSVVQLKPSRKADAATFFTSSINLSYGKIMNRIVFERTDLINLEMLKSRGQ